MIHVIFKCISRHSTTTLHFSKAWLHSAAAGGLVPITVGGTMVECPKKFPLILMNLCDLIVIGLIKMCSKFWQKITRKCLFYMQNSVWKPILKIPWDGRDIHGKLWGFTVLRGKSKVFMGIMGYYGRYGLLELRRGNNMYDGPPTSWFVTCKVLKSKEQYTQYGHGLNYITVDHI